MSKGHRVSTQSHISWIKANLLDRYQAESIVRELLQNADDGKATECHIGWTQGLPKAGHELLRGPAVVVVNDGEFTSTDAAAIRELGLSHRIAERSAIGKFGMGLKSVYHLCEAFFFLVRRVDSSVELDILNPWSGFPGHEDHYDRWDTLCDADADLMCHIVRPFGVGRMFLLWLPLRRETHSPRGTQLSFKTGECLGESTSAPTFLDPEPLQSALPPVLPMLKRLRRISLWSEPVAEGPLGEVMRVEVSEGSVRTRFGNGDLSDEPQLMDGSVQIELGENGCRSPRAGRFVGTETVSSDKWFLHLKGSPKWPRPMVLGLTDASKPDEGDKNEAHGAVYFYDASGGVDTGVSVQRAAFLPLGDPERLESGLRGRSVRLVVHGQYFIDPGRRQQYDGKEDHPLLDLSELSTDKVLNGIGNQLELFQVWNESLERRVIAPLVLPALKRLVMRAETRLAEGAILDSAYDAGSFRPFTEEEIIILTSALQRSRFYGKLRRWICGQYQWVGTLGRDSCEWRLLPSNTIVYSLPAEWKRHLDEAFAVFRGLERLVAEICVTVDRLPYLTLAEPKTDWPARLAKRLLDVDVNTLFSHSHFLGMLCAFLERCAPTCHSDDELQALLRDVLRQALASPGFATVRSNTATARFLGLVRDKVVLEVDDQKPDNLKAFLSLSQLRLSTLLIPASLLPNVVGQEGRLSTDDANAMLTALGSSRSRFAVGARDALACQVVTLHDGERNVLRQQAGQHAVFKGLNCSTRKSEAISWNDLVAAHEKGRLFLESDAADDIEREYAQALQDQTVLRVSPGTARAVLGSASAVGACLADLCEEALGKRPALSAPDLRWPLLERLMRAWDRSLSASRIEVLRYLLHGRADCFTNMQPLFLPPDSGDNEGVWHRLVDPVLKRRGEDWRFLSPELASELPATSRWKRELRLDIVRRDAFCDIAREMGPESVEFEVLSADELRYVLRELDDASLIVRLRMHRDICGRLVAAPAGTYLEGPYPLEGALLDGVPVIVAWVDDPALLRKQQSLPGVRMLDAVGALHLMLTFERPEVFSTAIMDALQASANGNYGEDVLSLLRQRLWLPLVDGRAAKPEDVISLPDLDDRIAALLRPNPCGYSSVLDLRADVREHRGFALVRQWCLPPPDDAIDLVGELLIDRPDLSIGPKSLQQVPFADLRTGLEGIGEGLLPTWALLAEIGSHHAYVRYLDRLLPRALKPLPIETLRDVLNWLASACGNKQEADRRDLRMRLHAAYLAAAVELAEFASVLPSISLMSHERQWTLPSRLCVEAPGIHPRHLLHPRQASLLKAHVSPNCGTPRSPSTVSATGAVNRAPKSAEELNRVVREASRTLLNYVDGWEEYTPHEVVGAFLYAFSWDDSLTGRVTELLRDHALEPIESAMGWLHQATSRSQARVVFDLRVDASDTITLLSLVDTPFAARKSQDVSELILGHPSVLPLPALRAVLVQVTLRQIDAQQYGAALGELLLHTTERLADLWGQFGVSMVRSSLRGLWGQLEEVAQLDIRVAQKLLMNNAFLVITQLPPDARPPGSKIDSLLKRYRQTQRELAQDEMAQSHTRSNPLHYEIKGLGAQLSGLSTDICNLIESDRETHAALLASVRVKLRDHFQYSTASIPFELFQNADDAVGELEKMEGRALEGPPYDEFRFWVSEEGIVFGHWGRPINCYRKGERVYRDDGFDRDLEKMLFLHESDKSLQQVGENLPTGKFGLGFKSVFLAADVVRVVSDRLAFEVVGGAYPRRLARELARPLSERIHSPHASGTAIWMVRPGNVGSEDWTRSVLDRFERCVPLLLAFSHRVKRARGSYGTARELTWEWAERPVDGCPGIRVGTSKDRKYLHLGCADGSVLVRLGAAGPEHLEPEMPRCWVTTPLDEELDVGFAFNGRFAVNIGRVGLAGESGANCALAERLGYQVGRLLVSLAELMAEPGGWSRLVSVLGLSHDATPESFWALLWNVLASGLGDSGDEQTPGRQLASIVSARSLTGTSTCPVIPSGLWGPYDTLTGLSLIRHYASGLLAEKVWFERAQHLLPEEPGTCVHNRQHELLSDLQLPSYDAKSLRLEDLLLATVGLSSQVDPGTAERLGAAFTGHLLDDATLSHFKERQQLRHAVQSLRFRSDAGSFDLAGRLVSAAEADERLLAAFAPQKCVLDSAYRGAGLALFALARGRQGLTVSDQEIVEWATQPSDLDARAAVLRYLATPRGSVIGYELQTQGSGWWDRVWSDGSLEQVKPEDQHRLQVVLGHSLLRHEQQEARREAEVESTARRPLAPDAIEKIWDWWEQDGPSELLAYDRSVYPDGKPPNWVLKPQSQAELEEWMTLLLMGCFHTMGRTRPGAHRSFIMHCKREGWLQSFADSDTPPTFWVELLDKYLDKCGEEHVYFEWVLRLPLIYQLSRWLKDYTVLFSMVSNKQYVLDLILAPNTNPSLRGLVNAPSLRKVLSIGACFVLRELVRARVHTSDKLLPYCFVPTRGVRRVYHALSGDQLAQEQKYNNSPVIATWLGHSDRLGSDRFHFNFAFDIPFRIIAERPELQERLLGEPLPPDPGFE